jgi:DNA-binding NtrC family response regulator
MDPLAELIGESPGILAVRETVKQLLLRHSDTRRLPPILIQGETGTGKGLLARAIHRAGLRAAGPFVDVNCAAIPDTLLEAELFGFERGAFTDARHAKAGLFQTAHRGTIFLDEVGLLPEGLQAKLLKAIEDRAVRRLGGTRCEPVDIWILTASNEDLEAATRTRRFREDLYHRLAVVTLRLPPLRERGRDILTLAKQFLARACADYALPPRALAEDARDALLAYRWPGNIRELSNVMERVALLSAEAPLVTAATLGLVEGPAAEGRGPARGTAPARAAEKKPLDDDVEGAERARLLGALQATRWNISRAAVQLGLSRNTLRYRMEKHTLHPGVAPAGPMWAPAPGTRPTDWVPQPEKEEPPAAAAQPEVSAAVPGASLVPAAVHPGIPPAGPAGIRPAGLRWERRHLALLRADLVVPPAGRAQPDTSRALEILVEQVQSFGGRVEELSATGVIAAFGLEPLEDAPRQAAHAAMAIQKAAERVGYDAAERVAVRCGLHVGQPTVGWVAGAARIDQQAKREAWGVLESLLAHAEPNAVLISEAARPFLERRFALVALGGSEGASGQACRLEDREPTGLGLGGRLTRFVDRHQELRLLERAC